MIENHAVEKHADEQNGIEADASGTGWLTEPLAAGNCFRSRWRCSAEH